MEEFKVLVGLSGGGLEFFEVEVDVGEEVDFVDDADGGFEEDFGVFEGFIGAFGGAADNDAEVFAEIVVGGADEIADVFDDEQVEVGEVGIFEGLGDHQGVEMAGAVGLELDGVDAEGADSVGVAFGFDVAFDDEDFALGGEAADGLFDEAGFAGAGGAQDIEGEKLGPLEDFPVDVGLQLVAMVDAFFQFDFSHLFDLQGDDFETWGRLQSDIEGLALGAGGKNIGIVGGMAALSAGGFNFF